MNTLWKYVPVVKESGKGVHYIIAYVFLLMSWCESVFDYQVQKLHIQTYNTVPKLLNILPLFNLTFRQGKHKHI